MSINYSKWQTKESPLYLERNHIISNSCYSIAIRRVEKAWQYRHAYRDRKVRRRDFRKLWINRVAAGVRASTFNELQ
jgi:ribosomal protein L20